MKKSAPTIVWSALARAARAARAHAYAPYSKFQVGAAVLGASGAIHAGCNVENASYGLTQCAERNAVARAVGEGEERIVAVVVVAGGGLCSPCGACRQVLAEFADGETPVALVSGRERAIHRLGSLLPAAFGRERL